MDIHFALFNLNLNYHMVTLYVDENIIVLGRTDKKDEAEEGKLR